MLQLFQIVKGVFPASAVSGRETMQNHRARGPAVRQVRQRLHPKNVDVQSPISGCEGGCIILMQDAALNVFIEMPPFLPQG